jgi:hypothetical protein
MAAFQHILCIINGTFDNIPSACWLFSCAECLAPFGNILKTIWQLLGAVGSILSFKTAAFSFILTSCQQYSQHILALFSPHFGGILITFLLYSKYFLVVFLATLAEFSIF